MQSRTIFLMASVMGAACGLNHDLGTLEQDADANSSGGTLGAGGAGAGGVAAGDSGSATGGSGGTSGTACPLTVVNCPAITCVGGTVPNPSDSCGCPVCANKDAGGHDVACPPVACPDIACVGGTIPNPSDSCGCPVCANKDAGAGDTACPPVACPALACVGGAVANPDPCGCPLCANKDAGSAADGPVICSCPSMPVSCPYGYQTGPAPCGCQTCAPPHDGGACTWPASLTPTGDPNAVGCWASAAGADAGSTLTCSTGDYILHCVGSAGSVTPLVQIPTPDSSLGCTVLPIPTPSNQTYYCCPC